MKPEEVAWAAGFFEGEGHINYTAYTAKAEEALNAMMPYLFHKGEQAIEAVNKWKDYCENRAKNSST